MKTLIGFLLLFVIVSFTAGCAKKPSGEVVTFPDKNLETAIKNALKILERPIYESDIEKLKELIAFEKNIVNLNGIEHCTNLEMLYLNVNQVSDITPLSSLINLEILELGKNQVSSINPLISLTKLKRLYLYGNQINDISPLVNLTDLRVLYLNDNRIQDISPLATLSKIGEAGPKFPKSSPHLTLSNNQISDISSLVSNSGIGEEDRVNLKGNLLNDEAYDVHIPALQERGVKVWFDPKQ